MDEPAVKPPADHPQNDRDNVAIVANDGGLAAGTALTSGLVLVDRVPQGHKVAWWTSPPTRRCLRYGIPIGPAVKDIPAGSWCTNGC